MALALPQATLPSLPQATLKGLPFDVLWEIAKKNPAAYYALTTTVPELGRYSLKPHVQTAMKAHFTVHRECGKGIEWILPNGSRHSNCRKGIEWILPNGKRHSNHDNPAMVRVEHVFIEGQHEENVIQYWYKDGKRHRDDGPAIVNSFNDQYWYQNGIPYRADDKPHAVLGNGSREWYNAAGQLHRDKGPALILANGKEYWYHDGVRVLRS